MTETKKALHLRRLFRTADSKEERRHVIELYQRTIATHPDWTAIADDFITVAAALQEEL
jgi:hypothetical protein